MAQSFDLDALECVHVMLLFVEHIVHRSEVTQGTGAQAAAVEMPHRLLAVVFIARIMGRAAVEVAIARIDVEILNARQSGEAIRQAGAHFTTKQGVEFAKEREPPRAAERSEEMGVADSEIDAATKKFLEECASAATRLEDTFDARGEPEGIAKFGAFANRRAEGHKVECWSEKGVANEEEREVGSVYNGHNLFKPKAS